MECPLGGALRTEEAHGSAARLESRSYCPALVQFPIVLFISAQSLALLKN